jgi:hypothetical protein
VKHRKRGEGKTPGAELLTLEIGANAPCGNIRVPVEYIRVLARSRDCSGHGDDVERRVDHECVRREGNCHVEVVVSAGDVVVSRVRNGFVATAEEGDLNQWAKAK